MKVMEDVPYIIGLDKWLGNDLNDETCTYLKDFGAATASNGAVGLYHIDNLTPEAVELGKPARIVEYTGLICPLEKALKHGLSAWETDNSESVTQYISDVTEHELDEYLSAHPYVRESEITSTNLHCGTYFMIPRK